MGTGFPVPTPFAPSLRLDSGGVATILFGRPEQAKITDLRMGMGAFFGRLGRKSRSEVQDLGGLIRRMTRFAPTPSSISLDHRTPYSLSDGTLPRHDARLLVRRIAVLRNPASGRGATGRWPAVIQRLKGYAEIIETRSVEDLGHQATRLAAAEYDIVAAAGGDGTLHTVAQSLAGTETALAVLPMGTGNDFARTLGFGTDLNAAIDALEEGRIVTIDVGRWRQADRRGVFLNVAGCGFDAAVADRINHGIRGLRGPAAYLAAIVLTLRAFRPTRLRLVIDGETVESEAMLCALANAQSYGAGLRIAPMAQLQDGLLDLILVGPLGCIEFLRHLPGVAKGQHVAHPKVSHRPFRHLVIEAIPPSPFLIDGELLPPYPVEITVWPAALRCVVPERFELSRV